MSTRFRIAAVGLALALLATVPFVSAQQPSGREFPPPQEKGRVVVVSSGASGAAHYVEVSRAIAKLGYDVVLFDGNAETGAHGDGLKSAIEQAMGMPHALPGKVALVGFSRGGGESLFYGARWPAQVAGVVAWYPANSFIRDVPGFASRLGVRVVAFAGGRDDFRNGCCTAAKDLTLQAAARAAGKSFDLTVYPEAQHDFVKGGMHYDPSAYADAFARTAVALKSYFAQ